jgi:hypothetical protein
MNVLQRVDAMLDFWGSLATASLNREAIRISQLLWQCTNTPYSKFKSHLWNPSEFEYSD